MEIKFSYFEGFKESNAIISVDDYIQITKNNPQKEIIEQIRQLIRIKGRDETKKERDELKKQLYSVTPNGIFNNRTKENVIKGTQIMHHDFDKLTEKQMIDLKEFLEDNDYIFMYNISPSGDGLKVFIRIPEVDNDYEYKQYWSASKSILGDFTALIDKSTSDITRLCFLSQDEHIYYNPNSWIFTEKDEKIKEIEKIEINASANNIIEKYWTPGVRNELAMYVTAYLRSLGFGMDSVKQFITNICHNTHDEDIANRIRQIEYTYSKDENEIKGFYGLLKYMKEQDLQELIAMMKDIDNEVPKTDYEILNALDLAMEDMPEMEFLIQGMLSAYGVNMIGGKPSVGKSFFCICMGIAMAIGGEFLGMNFEKKRVLYIDEENGVNSLHKRLRGLIKANFSHCDITPLRDNFKFVSMNNFKAKNVAALFEQVQPDIVFIDSFVRFSEGDENSADGVKNVFEILKMYQQDMAFYLIHHLKKDVKDNFEMDDLRGSGDIAAMMSSIIGLYPGKDNEINVKCLKLRDDEASKGAIKYKLEKEEENKIKINFIGRFEEEYSKLTEAKKFIMHNSVNDAFHSTDMCTRMKNNGFTKKNYYDCIKQMVDTGEIRKLKNGIYEIVKKSYPLEDE